MLERRKFLTALTAGMATAIVPAGIIAATLRRPGNSVANASLHDRLAPLIGNTFRLADSNGVATRAQLIAVDDGPQCRGLEQFSIVFEGTDLTEGLYEVYHRQTGSLLISLMPSGEPGPGKNRKRVFFSTFV